VKEGGATRGAEPPKSGSKVVQTKKKQHIYNRASFHAGNDRMIMRKAFSNLDTLMFSSHRSRPCNVL